MPVESTFAGSSTRLIEYVTGRVQSGSRHDEVVRPDRHAVLRPGCRLRSGPPASARYQAVDAYRRRRLCSPALQTAALRCWRCRSRLPRALRRRGCRSGSAVQAVVRVVPVSVKSSNCPSVRFCRLSLAAGLLSASRNIQEHLDGQVVRRAVLVDAERQVHQPVHVTLSYEQKKVSIELISGRCRRIP